METRKIDLTPIYAAIDDLTDFLLENTESVFEEIPEADNARAALQDFAEAVEKSGQAESRPHYAARIKTAAESLLNDIDAMKTGAESFGDFEYTAAGEYASAAEIEWPNLAISAANLRRAIDNKESGE